MVESGGDTTSSLSTRLTTSFLKIGDRTRFTVDLRPGETTIVSWKKLSKDAAKSHGGSSSSPAVVAAASDAPPAAALPSLESRVAPGQVPANELEDAPTSNRFSAVIEKIERLYMGKDSSDEEDMNDIPDDDQYDTEDSFIDDAELDEYFEVDKSKTKHDGYFVNRGALEKVSEQMELANQQPKKRRRKDVAKAPDDNDANHRSMKVGRKGAGKNASSVEKNMLPTTQVSSVKTLEGMKIQSQRNVSETYHQKIAGDVKTSLNFSQSLRAANGDASSSLAEMSDRQTAGMPPVKNPNSNLKETNAEESQIRKQQKDKRGMREKIDLNLPDSKHTMQPVKTSVVHKKESSTLKPKANSLEKAIRELEKIVAESRPRTAETQDADASSSVKRRLPREIKLKLAKVARLGNASNGKVSQELLNRLMGILGHLCQVRTLKRHLKIMMNTSLSAKQEKDDKFQLTKKEVIELIKARVPSLVSKVAEMQSGGSSDVPESCHSDKALKGQLCIDATLEDKICDLYDIFVDGLDEEAAPQIRKLYAELAELWPKGVMDYHGIKRAICRAKERKRSMNETKKDQEKIKRKKVVATITEDGVRVDSASLAPLPPVELRMASDPGIAVAAQQSRLDPSTPSSADMPGINSAHITSVSIPLPSTNVPNFERSKHKKVKGTQNNAQTDGRIIEGMVVKKKVKRRAELTGEGHLCPDKFSSLLSNDRQKQHKHAVPSLQDTSYKSSYDVFRFEPLT